jgi:cation-transporting P-type ATPase 13A2
VSLSEADASIAAPFTSRIANISCIPTLLREGRCAIVTSFQAFKYMAAYSLIQFSTVLILYSIGAILGNWQFLYIDLALVLPLAFISVYTGAHHKLSKRRPVCTLLSREVLLSLLSQTLINVLFQLAAFGALYLQPWYVPMLLLLLLLLLLQLTFINAIGLVGWRIKVCATGTQYRGQ